MATATETAKAAQDSLLAVVGKTSFSCLMALLQFILADPILRSTIITFLEACRAQIALQKALLQLAVAQLRITLSLLQAEVAAAGALFGIANGLGNRFPLGVFSKCPLTAGIVNAAQKGVDSIKAGGGSSGSKVFNALREAKTKIRDIQYKIARMTQLIDQTNANIEKCTLLDSQILAIENFVNALANYPGQFTLPLT